MPRTDTNGTRKWSLLSSDDKHLCNKIVKV